MELNTISLNDFVKLANVIWLKAQDQVMQAARNSGMFVIDTISDGTGDTRQYSEIDLQQYAKVKAEDDQAERAKVQQGYTKTLTPYRVALDIGISYEMRTRNKYPEVMRRLTSLGSTPAARMELDLSHRFTFGTALTYADQDGRTVDVTTGDSLALFYSAHTIKGSSTTYRNRLAGNPRLSKGAIEGMERLIAEETINQFGEKMAMPFDILWTTDDPNTINTALEYLHSVAAPDSANAGVTNTYKGKYKLVILPLVATDKDGFVDATKRYYWGLASSKNTTAMLGIWEAPRLITPPTAGNNGENRSTDSWEFGTRAGYGICIVNAQWIKFSSGDGVA